MSAVLKKIEENRLIAVIRSGSAEDAEEMIKAALAGGFRIFEVSLQTPQALRIIEAYSKKEGILVGAGTVTDGEIAQRAIKSGASFVSTPYTDREVIIVAKHNASFAIQGALTPTEVMNAYQMGADLVMINPIASSGGPQYLKSLKNAVPSSTKLIVAGGVSLESVFDYLKDSLAVCVKQSLFEKPLVRTDNWQQITERARQFSEKLETIKVSR